MSEELDKLLEEKGFGVVANSSETNSRDEHSKILSNGFRLAIMTGVGYLSDAIQKYVGQGLEIDILPINLIPAGIREDSSAPWGRRFPGIANYGIYIRG